MQNSQTLDELEDVAKKRQLEQLREDIKKKFDQKNWSEKPFKYLTARLGRMEKFGMRILYTYQEVNQRG